MKNKNIYLDNHSSTQIDERVYKQMIPFLTNVFGNPHSDSHSHGWISNKFIDLSRLKDVLMMMILLHVWPEQTYRFSTRKCLPKKENRFSKESKPSIPYDLLADKGSNIAKMKEINVIGRGSSFNLNNLKL